MKVLIPIFIALLISGCCEKSPDPEQEREVIYTHTTCPTFDRNLSIQVTDLNSTHGGISWENVTKVENMLKAKKNFNTKVEELNAE